MKTTGIYRTRAMALAAALALTASGCATTGATLGSGVGDRLLKEAPYVAGRAPGALRVAHLPVAWQPGASHEPSFDPAGGPGTPVAALLAEMNAYLDSLDVSAPLDARAAQSKIPRDQ